MDGQDVTDFWPVIEESGSRRREAATKPRSTKTGAQADAPPTTFVLRVLRPLRAFVIQTCDFDMTLLSPSS
jgi:hypothetical protein